MSVSTVSVRPGVRLSVEKRAGLLRYAQMSVLSAMMLSGVYIALQIAILAPYAGTSGDAVMRTFSYLVMFGALGTAFKALLVPIVGPRVERRLEKSREVKLRYIFNREIRWHAIWGGALQALYAMIFVFMAPYLAPTALAASRACIVLALVPVEWWARVS